MFAFPRIDEMTRLQPRILFSLFTLLFSTSVSSFALAQGLVPEGMPVSYEYNKKIKTGAPEALSSGMFGEQVSQYDGSTSFSVTDIDVPGNNELTVRLTRRFSVESRPVLTTNYDARYGGAGDWSIDIPFISSTYPVETQYPMQLRCSGGGGVPTVISEFLRSEFWTGIDLNIPGRGETKLLSMTAMNSVPRPTDGVSRTYTTNERDAIDCIPLKNGLAGEGYRVTTISGMRYYFDIETTRKDSPLETVKYLDNSYVSIHLTSPVYPQHGLLAQYLMHSQGLSPSQAWAEANTYFGVERPEPEWENDVIVFEGGGESSIPVIMQRSRYFLLPSRIEDRFGNFVTYEYNSAGHPTRIASNDGREINLLYQNQRLVSASSHGKTWAYTYLTSGPEPLLKTATQPDGSLWEYSQTGSLRPEAYGPDVLPTLPWCGFTPQIGGEFQLTIKHPSGASGKFDFVDTRHYRSGVHVSECVRKKFDPVETFALVVPNYYDTLSIAKKSISGPSISGSQNWNYDFGENNYDFGGATIDRWGNQTTAFTYPCTTCATSKTTKITNPDGSKALYTYGILYKSNEGRLLGVDTMAASGLVLSSERNVYMTDQQVAQSGFFGEYGLLLGGVGNPVSTMVRPQVKHEVTQQGVNFVSTVNSFDSLARAINITKSSSLGYSKTDAIVYHDDRNKWILGQVKSVTNTNTGNVVSQTDYDPVTLLPIRKYTFGQLDTSFTYLPDGNISTIKDALNRTTTLSNYYRGVPRSIIFPDSTTISATVNTDGTIASTTDPLGNITSYEYDLMGRLTKKNFPIGDSTAWASMNYLFRKKADGKWAHSTWNDTYANEVIVDDFWRPSVQTEWDWSNPSATARQTVWRYDTMGRTIFQSYPFRGVTDFSTLPGIHTEYDALGRVTKTRQDSELGPLNTTTEYLTGFKTKVTNPRGFATTTSYQVFDAPDTSHPEIIVAPEGQTTTILRNVYGNPLSVNRSGIWNSAAISGTRSYVYDAQQRLCKRIEPETGASVVDYDAAGNVAWSAEGQNLLANTCDRASVPASEKTNFVYDAMNRVTSVTYPDGINNTTSTYEADGKLKTVVSNGSTWSFEYNKRRLLTKETLNFYSNYVNSYGYNANGDLASYSTNNGTVVDYAPNALGQPTKASGYATNVQYYPNGAMKQFTYGNGIVHTMAQNIRQFASETRDALGSTAITHHTAAFDANGNLTSYNDLAENGRTNRAMQYDALDRLTQAHAPNLWGMANYQYDVLDNLRRSTLGLAGFNYVYDANNRVQRIDRDASGSYAYTFDARGNVLSDGRNNYNFTRANRLAAVTGKETYQYDGFGRRVVGFRQDGTGYVPVYSQDGELRYTADNRKGGATTHVLLNGSQIAEHFKKWSDGTVTVTYTHTDALGSPIATTNSAGGIVERTDYAPYGAPFNRPVDGVGYTGHVMDQATGLVYAQQRYYDPMLGRFLSPDPVETDPNSGASFNRYNYANNNPYRFTDPDGRESKSKGFVIHEPAPSADGCGGLDDHCGPEWRDGSRSKAALEASAIFVPVERAASGLFTMGKAAWAYRIHRNSVVQKLEKYLLNPDHPVGKSKAEWFSKALGFTKENMGDLAKQIVFDPKSAKTTAVTEFGTKYNQTIAINGANGKTINVVFGWIKNKDNIVRLVTGVPAKK